jgi:hypothetical protein
MSFVSVYQLYVEELFQQSAAFTLPKASSEIFGKKGRRKRQTSLTPKQVYGHTYIRVNSASVAIRKLPKITEHSSWASDFDAYKKSSMDS